MRSEYSDYSDDGEESDDERDDRSDSDDGLDEYNKFSAVTHWGGLAERGLPRHLLREIFVRSPSGLDEGDPTKEVWRTTVKDAL